MSTPTTPHFRLNPQRATTARRAFLNHISTAVPHMREEAEAQALAMFGPEAEVPGDRYVRERGVSADPLLRRAEVARQVLKRAPLHTTVAVDVAGDLTKQMLQVWKAYRAACGEAWDGTDITLNVIEGVITLHWDTRKPGAPGGSHGAYRLLSGQFTRGDENSHFTGTLEVAADLLTRGGAYQLITTPTGFRLESLVGKLATWKIALALARDEWGRRRFSSRSLQFEDILRRFRNGGTLSYASVAQSYGKRETKVSLTAGKADGAVTASIKAQLEHAAALAERVKEYIARLESWATAEAVAYADRPEVRTANAERELESARETFRFACDRYYNIALRVVLKKDMPAAPFRVHPGKFPPAKSVADGLKRQYLGTCHEVDSSWERLIAAVAAVPGACLPTVDAPPIALAS